MSDGTPSDYRPEPAHMAPSAPPAPPAGGFPAHVAAPHPPVAASGSFGSIGKIRGTGLCMLLTVVTFGIYPIVWYYQVHEEMKRHSGHGLGGGLSLVLAIFVGFVMPYVTASEVGALYEGRGLRKPVSGLTGLWYFPGCFLLIGAFIWFIKTNGALNNYWRSLGAH